MKPRNLAIVAVVLVFGLGGMQLRTAAFEFLGVSFEAGAFTVEGIGLAGLTGLVLHLVLPHPKSK